MSPHSAKTCWLEAGREDKGAIATAQFSLILDKQVRHSPSAELYLWADTKGGEVGESKAHRSQVHRWRGPWELGGRGERSCELTGSWAWRLGIGAHCPYNKRIGNF